MTTRNKIAIQRMLGIIEGATADLAGRTSVLIGDAIATIDGILDEDEGECDG